MWRESAGEMSRAGRIRHKETDRRQVTRLQRLGPCGAGGRGAVSRTDWGGGGEVSAGEGSQLPEGTKASSTGTTPRQMKAGSEQSPSGTTSLTPSEAARFSAARKRSRLILAAWA